MKSESVVVERVYDAPIAKVWSALTNKEELKKWYIALGDFKPEVGSEFQFLLGPDDKKYLHLCKVTEIVPGKKLAYSWRYDGYIGDSVVSFELSEAGEGKTKLKITHSGVETFPKEPAFAKENFKEGWTYTADALGKYVEAKKI